MKRWVLAKVLAGSIAALLLGACSAGNARPQLQQYQLAIPRIPLELRHADIPEIGDVSAAPPYEDTAVVYQTSPTQLGIYHYHRWISSPTELVRDYMEKLVGSEDDGQPTRPHKLILEARIDGFNELDEGDQTFGVVDIRFCLRRSHSKPKTTSCWRDRHLTVASDRSASAVVDAINRSFEETMVELSNQLTSRLGGGLQQPQRSKEALEQE